MKTKSKYFMILFAVVIIFSALFYVPNLKKEKVIYFSESLNENKLKQVMSVKNNLKSSELNILFVGDIMTDRYIRKQINKYTKEINNIDTKDENTIGAKNFVEKYLNNLKEINSKYDYVAANLEGPITENKSKTLNGDGSYGKDLIFTFPSITTQILKLLNIKVVSLANNHTDNFYNKGLQDTKKFLEKEDISYFGNPYNAYESSGGGEAAAKESLSKKICEKNICVIYIGYNQFTKNNNKEIISEEIIRVKNEDLESEKNKLDFVVVIPHWGMEYEKISSNIQKDYAREWIDSGADLVIGTHPHVIQESEIYKGKYIYYSLGNYIFDQWFSKDVQSGLGLDMIFKKECEEEICKKEIILNKELKIFIDRNGVRYVI